MWKWPLSVNPDGVFACLEFCEGFDTPFLCVGVPASSGSSQGTGMGQAAVDQDPARATLSGRLSDFQSEGSGLFDRHIVFGCAQPSTTGDDSDPLAVTSDEFCRIAAVVGFGFSDNHAGLLDALGRVAQWFAAGQQL